MTKLQATSIIATLLLCTCHSKAALLGARENYNPVSVEAIYLNDNLLSNYDSQLSPVISSLATISESEDLLNGESYTLTQSSRGPIYNDGRSASSSVKLPYTQSQPYSSPRAYCSPQVAHVIVAGPPCKKPSSYKSHSRPKYSAYTSSAPQPPTISNTDYQNMWQRSLSAYSMAGKNQYESLAPQQAHNSQPYNSMRQPPAAPVASMMNYQQQSSPPAYSMAGQSQYSSSPPQYSSPSTYSNNNNNNNNQRNPPMASMHMNSYNPNVYSPQPQPYSTPGYSNNPPQNTQAMYSSNMPPALPSPPMMNTPNTNAYNQNSYNPNAYSQQPQSYTPPSYSNSPPPNTYGANMPTLMPAPPMMAMPNVNPYNQNQYMPPSQPNNVDIMSTLRGMVGNAINSNQVAPQAAPQNPLPASMAALLSPSLQAALLNAALSPRPFSSGVGNTQGNRNSVNIDIGPNQQEINIQAPTEAVLTPQGAAVAAADSASPDTATPTATDAPAPEDPAPVEPPATDSPPVSPTEST